ncbi:MAG: hypothetical protein ACTSXV_01980 [Alphaproteobacteria bacterium]
MSIEDIKLNATLVNGRFSLANSQAHYAGGKVKFSATGTIGNTLSAEVSVDGESVSVGEIVRMSEGGNIFDENTSLANVKIYLKGQGNTLAKLRGSLTGTGKVYTQKKTKGYGITTYFLGQDLISVLVDQFSEKGDDLEIKCIAGHIRIKNGVAYSNKGIALESDKINAVIEGRIDLGKEYTKVSLISKPTSGFQIGTSDFLSLVKIQGAMAEPDFKFSGSGLVEKTTEWAVAAGVASVFTGGLSAAAAGIGFLAKSWFDSFTRDKHPCLSALNSKYVEDDSINPTKTPVQSQILLLEKKAKKKQAQAKNSFVVSRKKIKQKLKKKISALKRLEEIKAVGILPK